MTWPTAGWLALTLTTAAVSTATPPKPSAERSTQKYESVVLSGKVVTLAEALKTTGLAFDPEPVAKQVVLKTDDGAITPILSDDASRALFRDDRLRNRKTVINSRRRPGLPYLQVVTFQVEDEGRLRTPEYYCEICTISVRFPQICPCCQGDMVLRMRPEPR